MKWSSQFIGFQAREPRKAKGSLDRSSLGLIDSLAVGVFNTLAGYYCLDRRLTEKGWTSIGKRKLLDERECFWHSSTEPRPDKGNQSVGSLTSWAGWPEPQPVQPFSPKNLSFSIHFFSNTQVGSLGTLIWQFWNVLPKVHLIKLKF